MRRGLSESWIAVGLILGAWFNWRLVAGRLRVYTELTRNALTLPDYFTHRFEDRGPAAAGACRPWSSWCSSRSIARRAWWRARGLFERTFGLSYRVALWASAVRHDSLCVRRRLPGGELDRHGAGAADDLRPAAGAGGGAGQGRRPGPRAGGHSRGGRPHTSTGFAARRGSGIISLLAWGLGYMGQPHILARFMSASSVKVIPNARRIGMTWMILCLLGAMAVGFFGIAYFAAHPEQAAPVRANRETVFITLSQVLFNPWIAGILLAAILAAIMSTLSCQLLVCSSALTRGFLQTLPPSRCVAKGTGVGRPGHGAAGVGHRHRDRRNPGQPGAGPGGLRVGRLWRRVRAGGALLVVWPRMTRRGALAGHARRARSRSSSGAMAAGGASTRWCRASRWPASPSSSSACSTNHPRHRSPRPSPGCDRKQRT